MIPAERIMPINALSRRTRLRLGRGLSLWKEGGYAAILVTGGLYHDPKRQTVPASVLMKRWLVLHGGVDPDDIITEERSRDTFENVRLGLLRVFRTFRHLRFDVTVVSHPTHLRRFRSVFRAYGMRVDTVPVHYPLSIKERVLEAMMYAYHLFDSDGSGAVARMNRARRTSPAPRTENRPL